MKNTHLNELNISEENKILISKIEKRVLYLEKISEDYFEKTISISSDKIKNAYSNNEDLVSILNKNDDVIQQILSESRQIRIDHQTNFTREQVLNISQEIDNLSLINNTIDNHENLINYEDKEYVLSKKINYLKKNNKKRREEYKKALLELEQKATNENILNIDAINDDIDLIKNYSAHNKNSRFGGYYWISIVLFIISIVIIGGLIWAVI